jgi:Uma2 family endonuclease
LSTVFIGNQREVRKFTIEEYYKMAEAGIIRPSERVELLNGRIIQITPSSPRHQTIVDKLSEVFTEQTKGRYRVRVGGPIQISKFSEPEPDLVLYRRTLKNEHPKPPNIYLVVEVSDSSLPIDSGEKLKAYQECGIPEYWIIDLAKKVIRVHTLKDGRYLSRVKSRGTIAPQHFADVQIQINSLL